jgi:hypothetical protein
MHTQPPCKKYQCSAHPSGIYIQKCCVSGRSSRFHFLFFNCSPFIIQNCYTLFNAQKSRINKLIKFKQMGFLAETASEKRYDYYIICVCPLQEKTFQAGKQKAMQ